MTITTIVTLIAFLFPTPARAVEVPLVSPISPIQEVFPPILEKIAYCESQNNPHAKNKYSSASGRFQFINQSWYDYGLKLWGDKFYEKNIWSYKDNTELALYVYKIDGTTPWNSSKNCWSVKDI